MCVCFGKNAYFLVLFDVCLLWKERLLFGVVRCVFALERTLIVSCFLLHFSKCYWTGRLSIMSTRLVHSNLGTHLTSFWVCASTGFHACYSFLPCFHQGSTECVPCQFGTYSDSSGTKQCLPCATGTYADQLGTTAVCLSLFNIWFYMANLTCVHEHYPWVFLFTVHGLCCWNLHCRDWSVDLPGMRHWFVCDTNRPGSVCSV